MRARLSIVAVLVGSIILLASSSLASPRPKSEPERRTSQVSAPAASPTDASYLPIAMKAVPPTPVGGYQIPHFSHVFIIVMENEAYEQILGNTVDAPYINSLAEQYSVAANYYGIVHPSLPNYIALTAGDTFTITNDCTKCFIDHPNIVDQLEAAGKSWKAYMESMPSPCFVGDSGKLYQQKHNPFIYFDNIRGNPARCNKIVPLSQLEADLQANALPQYVWITPNMCNDIHDCKLSVGDAWLQEWVTKILASPAWQQNGVLFLTFDESNHSDNSGCCQYATGGHILTMVISPLSRPGYQSPIEYDHYSLLRTIEVAWGLPLLNKASCDCSLPMSDFFKPAATAASP